MWPSRRSCRMNFISEVMFVMTLKQIVDQLKSCGFQCEAGPLELNTAFIELERKANEEDDDGDYDGTLL